MKKVKGHLVSKFKSKGQRTMKSEDLRVTQRIVIHKIQGLNILSVMK
jgi:hypothetical protein